MSLEKLNTPKALVVVLAVFLVVDGFLFYQYRHTPPQGGGNEEEVAPPGSGTPLAVHGPEDGGGEEAGPREEETGGAKPSAPEASAQVLPAEQPAPVEAPPAAHRGTPSGSAGSVAYDAEPPGVAAAATTSSMPLPANATDPVYVSGQLEPNSAQKGHIEQIQFTDETITIGSETPQQAQTLSGDAKTTGSAEAQVAALNEASNLDEAEKERRSEAAKKAIEEAKQHKEQRGPQGQQQGQQQR